MQCRSEVERVPVVAAAIVDSRNVYHQAGDAIGAKLHPSVAGIARAFGRYNFDVTSVHMGLALARAADRNALSLSHSLNDSFRQRVIADGGHVLLGELHQKPDGTVQEKMVDAACVVRITRYVDEIKWGRTDVQAIIVLSKDIDLKPAIDYAKEEGVPIVVAALDVVQHRAHPYVLLGPHAYAEITDSSYGPTGHELRELLALALMDGKPLTWTVGGSLKNPQLTHVCGVLGVPAQGVALPALGTTVQLWPIDATWQSWGSFPLLICSDKPPVAPAWRSAIVKKRLAPMSLEIRRSDGVTKREQYPLGGVIPGETVVIHTATGRVLGRLAVSGARSFDPDTPLVVRVVSNLRTGGAIATDGTGVRGILTTDQSLVPGQRVPAVQIDLNAKGPVWAAIGTPIL